MESPGRSYSKEKWVVGDKQPLFSGFGCKQWLSGPWACQLTHRTDFACEMLRWQPRDCQMEESEGSKFLNRLLESLKVNWQSPSWKVLGDLHFKSLQIQHLKTNADDRRDGEFGQARWRLMYAPEIPSLLSVDFTVDHLKSHRS